MRVEVQEPLDCLSEETPHFSLVQLLSRCPEVPVQLSIVTHLKHKIHIVGILKIVVHLSIVAKWDKERIHVCSEYTTLEGNAFTLLHP